MITLIAFAGPDQTNLHDAILPLVADAADVLNGECADHLPHLLARGRLPANMAMSVGRMGEVGRLL